MFVQGKGGGLLWAGALLHPRATGAVFRRRRLPVGDVEERRVSMYSSISTASLCPGGLEEKGRQVDDGVSV